MPRFEPDGLLPALDGEDYEWLAPGEKGNRTRDIIGWVMSIGEVNRIIWPAEIDGVLVPPPAEHILDHLVRYEFTGSSNSDAEAELMIRPQARTLTTLSTLPACGPCSRDGRAGVSARYDGPLSPTDPRADWDFMCPDCYRRLSTRRLGTGEGQYLLLTSEIPADVTAAQQPARAFWAERTSTPLT
jgi:hypothetical protein